MAAPYIAGAAVLLLVSSAALAWQVKHQLERNGRLQATADQYQQSLADAEQDNAKLRKQAARLDNILANRDTAITHAQDNIAQLQRKIRNAPDASNQYIACRDVAIPKSVLGELRRATRTDQNDIRVPTDNPNP